MKLINLTHPIGPIELQICESFISRLRGLMFRPNINVHEGIGLISDPPGVINASIHMFFMKFDIAVIWLDGSKQVVGKTLAKKWHPYYAPGKPAMYTLELHPSHFLDFEPGDKVQFIDA